MPKSHTPDLTSDVTAHLTSEVGVEVETEVEGEASSRAARIARIPLALRAVVALALGGALAQLTAAFLFLAGMVGGSCDICGGMPVAGILVGTGTLAVAVTGAKALIGLVRPGFRLSPRLAVITLLSLSALRYGWPW